MLYSELERGFDKKKRFSRIGRKSFCQSFHPSRQPFAHRKGRPYVGRRDMRKPKAVLACYRVIRNLTTPVPHLEKKGRETLFFPPLSANFSTQIRTFPSEYEEKKMFFCAERKIILMQLILKIHQQNP